MTLEKKKTIGWEVYLFFALYIIAPSYLAVELHSKLPLITLSRAVLMLMGLGLIIRRRRELFCLRKMHFNFTLTDDKFLRWGLVIYFVLMLITHLALVPADAAEAVKALFTLVVEYYAMTWLLTLILDTRSKLLAALRTLVIAAGVTAIVSIVGCIFDTNPFHYLNTVEREMLMTTYYRLGVLRVEAGFGHPVFYGAFCAIITPVMMYFYEDARTWGKKIFYGGCLTVNLVAMVLSNSRGSLLAFGGLVGLIVLMRLVTRRFGKFLLAYLPIAGATVVVLVGVTALTPTGTLLLKGIVDSLVAVFTPQQSATGVQTPSDTPSAAPSEPVVDYGENAAGTRSRLVQMTGILYTLARKPIFGFGSNAHVRGLVKFEFRPGQWWISKTFDMGIVSIVCQYGIVGLLAYISLYGAILKTIICKKYHKDPLMQTLGLAFVTFLACLLAISSLNKVSWIMIAAVVCLVNIIRTEQEA